MMILRRREELDDPEQEFLLRLQERHGDSVDPHAILHCVLGDLKSYSDLKAFLEFEKKQTTAPEKLKNPAGHYRRVVGKFYESRVKRRDWDIRSQMRALEAKLGSSAGAAKQSKTCSLASYCLSGCFSKPLAVVVSPQMAVHRGRMHPVS
ncbi:MAG: hypothetical protein WA324_20910, partial [Bryobacteraceae bacterium]